MPKTKAALTLLSQQQGPGILKDLDKRKNRLSLDDWEISVCLHPVSKKAEINYLPPTWSKNLICMMQVVKREQTLLKSISMATWRTNAVA